MNPPFWCAWYGNNLTVKVGLKDANYMSCFQRGYEFAEQNGALRSLNIKSKCRRYMYEGCCCCCYPGRSDKYIANKDKSIRAPVIK